MAEMVPDRLPVGASAGERRLFSILEVLPDDCIVYYEPLVRARYPDFIVIIPDVGVLVIEVKGWYPGTIVSVNAHDVLVRSQGIEKQHPHPTRQAREYKHRLMDECAAQPACSVLLNKGGQYKGRFKIPFGHIAVLSNITEEQLQSAADGAFAKQFGGPAIVTRDEMERWQSLSREELKEELRKRFDPSWPIAPMTSAEINALRAVIHPEIKLVRQHVDPGDILVVLDVRQERNARQIGSGHRVIYGVAGSGKTVLLIARAKLVAQDESKQILVLCYNKALARYLRSVLDLPNVHVHHFHQWGSANHISFVKSEANDAYGERLLARLECGEGDAQRYDAVLIDEAQDFCCSWFTCAKLALKEPDDGDLVIVGDGGQSVYRRRTFTWAEAGIHAVGRTINLKFDLNTNYRNTREILLAAHSFAHFSDGTDADTTVPVRHDTCVRSGPPPAVISKDDRAGEIEAISQLVHSWIESGVQIASDRVKLTANEIGILYPRLRKKDQATFDQLRSNLSEFGTVVLSGISSDGHYHDRGVKLTTIFSAKGLQFKAVILMWAD